jgi:carboxyl-terminal processing protease
MQKLSALTGIWKSAGYGWILDISDSAYRFYHHSDACLIDSEQGDPEAFFASFDRIHRAGDELTLFNFGDISEYRYRRIAALPELTVYLPGSEQDPQLNFKVLSQNFSDHYAFFEMRGIDWQALHNTYATRSESEESLWQELSELLPVFNDGHVSLSDNNRAITCPLYPALRESFQRAAGTPSRFISPRSTADALHRHFDSLFLAPFAASRSEIKHSCNEILHWCELTPGIAYLSVVRLFGFADSDAAREANDIPHDRRALGRFLEDDIATLNSALDEVFTDLKHMHGLVLDIRINGGGFDRAGKVIAERLTDIPRLAWQKRGRAGDGFNPLQQQILQPTQRPGFAGPVVALISPLCLSAGEIFTLCLRALPQVTLAGTATAGMLSDNLNKPLPNGWELSLSNEIYESHDGVCFEGRGVPPDVLLKTLSEQDCKRSLHSSLQQAVALLEQQIESTDR